MEKNLKFDEKVIDGIFKKISKDVIKYLPSKIFPALIGLISLPIYTNIFPPEDYGIYSMIISAVGLISSLLSGWLSSSAIRFFDEYTSQKKIFFSTIYGSFIIVYIISFLLFALFLLFPVEFGLDRKYLITAALLVATASLLGISRNVLRANRNVNLYSIFSMILPGGKLILVIILNRYFSFLGVLILLLSTIVIEMILIIIFAIYLKPKISLFNIDKNFLNRTMIFGIPLFLNTTLTWILSVSDRYLIGFLSSYKETGLYSISYSIGSQSLNLVFTSIMLGAYPLIIKAWNEHNQEYVENLISRLIKYFYILCIPIVSALFVIGPLLISLLASNEYYKGYLVLPWVGLGIFMSGLSQYVHKIWELTENTKMILILHLIAAISNLILNIIFIPKFGFVAAGITTFISYTLYLILSIYLIRNEFNINLFNKNVLLIIFSAVVMLGPVKILYNYFGNTLMSFIIILISGSIFYFVLLYFLGVIKNEILIIKSKLF